MVVAPLIRSGLIKNGAFIEQYRALKEAELLNEHELKELQFNQLKTVLIHAYEHTSYYRDLFNQADFNPYQFETVEELRKIPLLTKELIESNFDALQADDISDFYVGETGGSTGKPLRFYWSVHQYIRKKHLFTTFGLIMDMIIKRLVLQLFEV